MTRQEIIFNYNQAIKQAEQLDNIASKIEKLAIDKMETTTGVLKTTWQSDSSPEYIRKMGTLQDKIKGNAKKIKKVAETIRKTAEDIKRAELRALEIAKMRSYK